MTAESNSIDSISTTKSYLEVVGLVFALFSVVPYLCGTMYEVGFLESFGVSIRSFPVSIEYAYLLSYKNLSYFISTYYLAIIPAVLLPYIYVIGWNLLLLLSYLLDCFMAIVTKQFSRIPDFSCMKTALLSLNLTTAPLAITYYAFVFVFMFPILFYEIGEQNAQEETERYSKFKCDLPEASFAQCRKLKDISDELSCPSMTFNNDHARMAEKACTSERNALRERAEQLGCTLERRQCSKCITLLDKDRKILATGMPIYENDESITLFSNEQTMTISKRKATFRVFNQSRPFF